MGDLKIGDIVARKSYGGDIFFEIIDINKNGEENIVTLKGVTYRIEADAPESDLFVQREKTAKENNGSGLMANGSKTEILKANKKYDGKKNFFARCVKKLLFSNFQGLGKFFIFMEIAIVLLLIWISVRGFICK